MSCAAAQTSDQACLFITACSPGSVGKFSPTKPESNLQSPASLQRDQQYASQRNSFATHLSLLVGLLSPSSPLRYMVLSKITACFCEMRPQWVSPPACANLITSSGILKVYKWPAKYFIPMNCLIILSNPSAATPFYSFLEMLVYIYTHVKV